jgi:uncharacterized protein YjbI with pentapeptide repeats
VFCAGVRFFGSVFEDAADFAGARFDAQLELSGAKLNGSADFRGESLEECAFTGTSFRGPAQFDGATSADEVSSLELSATLRTRRSLATSATGVSCRGELDLEAATFENRIALGPMRLDDTTFNRSVHVEVSAARVTCDGATFHGGAELLLGGADVSLEGTLFGEDSLVTAIRAPRDTGAIPRVISLRGADVSRLTLSASIYARAASRAPTGSTACACRTSGSRNRPDPGRGDGGRAGRRWPKSTTGGHRKAPGPRAGTPKR